MLSQPAAVKVSFTSPWRAIWRFLANLAGWIADYWPKGGQWIWH
jgi:hypothetical protein